MHRLLQVRPDCLCPISLLPYRICSLQHNQFCICYWCVVINPFFIDKLIRKCIRFANECYICMLKWVTQFPIVPHICVSEFGQHWFRLCLVAYSAPSHCLNQCWVIVSWALGNRLQWHFNQGGRQHLELWYRQYLVGFFVVVIPPE